MAIGPISPATRLITTVMMSLNVGESTCVATAMDSPRNTTVVTRAATRPDRSPHARAAGGSTAPRPG
ncbi:hypothetical protein SALBM217S_03973 [Streptomyces griseoloalbus]